MDFPLFNVGLSLLLFCSQAVTEHDADTSAQKPPPHLSIAVQVLPESASIEEQRTIRITLRNGGCAPVELFNPELERHLPTTMHVNVFGPDGNLVRDVAMVDGGSRRAAIDDANWTLLKSGESKAVELPLRLARSPNVVKRAGQLPTGRYTVRVDALNMMLTMKPWGESPRLFIDAKTTPERERLIYKMRSRMEIKYPKNWDKVFISAPEATFSVTDSGNN